LAPACELLKASGYVQEALLTDYVLPFDPLGGAAVAQGGTGSQDPGGLVIPVSVDDLAANGLLAEAGRQVCWERSVETLTARKDEIAGLAVASDERIEACVLYVARGSASAEATADKTEATEILSLRSFVEDGEARLKQLLVQLGATGMATFRIPKVHPEELSKE